MNLFHFLLQNHEQVLELTLEHLWLVGVSTVLAVLIGIPLGILSAHWPVWNKPVLGTANIIQTIPSLALFGFLLPVPWLGDRADRLAILALTLYALLPVIRNTYTGIRGVDPAVVEAGRGMGLTGPPAPVSSRVAAGAERDSLWRARRGGRLGGTRHHRRRNWRRRFGRVHLSRPRHGKQSAHPGGSNSRRGSGVVGGFRPGMAGEAVAATMKRDRRRGHCGVFETARGCLVCLILVCSILAALLLSSCASSHTDRIVVGSKNFTESLILGELLAQQIEANTHLKVERRFYLAGTYICQQAMLAGRIDIYPEYTGTALTAILKQKVGGDRAEVYQRVKSEYEAHFGLTLGPPFGFNDTFAMEIRGDDARRLGVKTLSQAAAFAPQWRAGFGYEFMERPDGYAGLAAAYGLHFAAPPRVMDLGLARHRFERSSD